MVFTSIRLGQLLVEAAADHRALKVSLALKVGHLGHRVTRDSLALRVGRLDHRDTRASQALMAV